MASVVTPHLDRPHGRCACYVGTPTLIALGGATRHVHDENAALSSIGPYRITGVLGRGGMGVVYRGVHRESGDLAALKTLHSTSHSPLASIRREIHALGRLRHPGVVGIVGHGVSDAGVPWYAMDLLLGRTLRSLLASSTQGTRAPVATAVPPATETKDPTTAVVDGIRRVRRMSRSPADRLAALSVVWRSCEALAYLHAMGVVHRDLKPDNIFVREDGNPVLVDLGLAASFAGQRGREQLDLTGEVLGTVAYMAPEQIRGELVDARADLYALGCILYECVVGEPPFDGVPSFAILDAHLRRRPLPPSEVADDVPADLDRLIMRLLEKQPHDRIGYADDVAAALEPHVGGSKHAEGPPSGRRTYLYRPPFVGRDAAVKRLNDAVGRVGSVGRLYVAGESGVGKTRLVLETVNKATWRDISIVLSQCGSLGVGADAASRDRPLHAFASGLLAVVDYCRNAGAAETLRLLGPWAKILAPYQPAIEQVSGYAQLPEPTTVGPREARERVLSALDEVLHAFAAVRPLVIVIDDLQWADDLSLAFLQRPSRAGALLIVGTYRADEASLVLREIVTAPGCHRLDLERFGFEAVSAMVRGMLALDNPPTRLVEFLQRQCNGNPFFVVSYLQAAIGEGLLARHQGGRWTLGASNDLSELEHSLQMPKELTALIDLRLRRLSAEALGLVQTGAVLGRAFDAELLFACAEVSGASAIDTLQTLRDRQILEEAGNGELRFVHDKIREIAYEGMRPGTAAELHRRAARTLEARTVDALASSQVLAEHFSRGGAHDRAAVYFNQAGSVAASAYANGDAVHCFRSAIRELAVASPAPEHLTVPGLLEKIGDIQAVTGEQESARKCFEDADAHGLDAMTSARLHRKIGKTWEALHRHEEALRSYARGADLLGESGVVQNQAWWHEVIQVTIERLWVHYWLNSVEQMESLIAQSAAVIEEHGTPYQRGRFMQLVAMRNIRKERYLVSDETVALARGAVDVARGHNDAENAALRFVLFFTLYLRGSLDLAEREGLAVLDWAKRAGAATLRVRTLTYLATTARAQGRIDAVRERLAEIQAACEPSSSGRTVTGLAGYYPGALHANLCWLALDEQRVEEAQRFGRSALASWAAERSPYPFQWLARLPLLAIASARGDAEEATDHAAALLQPDQQRLPQSLAEEVERRLLEARGTGHRFEADGILREARRHRFL